MYAAHCRWHILQQQLDAAVDRNHDNNGKVKPPRAAQFAPFFRSNGLAGLMKKVECIFPLPANQLSRGASVGQYAD